MSECIAKIRFIRYSDKKLRLRAKLLKGMGVTDALYLMKYENSKASRIIFNAIKSAVSNAVNNHGKLLGPLFIKEILVNKCSPIKRIQSRAKGRADRILKPISHLFVKIGEDLDLKTGAQKVASNSDRVSILSKKGKKRGSGLLAGSKKHNKEMKKAPLKLGRKRSVESKRSSIIRKEEM